MGRLFKSRPFLGVSDRKKEKEGVRSVALREDSYFYDTNS